MLCENLWCNVLSNISQKWMSIQKEFSPLNCQSARNWWIKLLLNVSFFYKFQGKKSGIWFNTVSYWRLLFILPFSYFFHFRVVFTCQLMRRLSNSIECDTCVIAIVHMQIEYTPVYLNSHINKINRIFIRRTRLKCFSNQRINACLWKSISFFFSICKSICLSHNEYYEHIITIVIYRWQCFRRNDFYYGKIFIRLNFAILPLNVAHFSFPFPHIRGMYMCTTY